MTGNLTLHQVHVFLRVTIAVILGVHGVVRVFAGTVGGFGDFLNGEGFPAGSVIAWALTVFEIGGGVLLAAGYFVRWIAAIWIIEIVMGIILVHAQNGWFVVGHQQGGVEFSVLIIIVLLAVAGTVYPRSK